VENIQFACHFPISLALLAARGIARRQDTVEARSLMGAPAIVKNLLWNNGTEK
jgi:hypothetical protein